MMDKNKKDFRLLRPRSTSAAITDGYRLYLDNFRKIFRATWLMAVIYAIGSGLLMNFLTTLLPGYFVSLAIQLQTPDNEAAGSLFLGSHLMLISAIIMFSVCSALLAGFGFSLLAEHRDTNGLTPPKRWFGKVQKKLLLRTLIAWCSLLVFVLLYLVAGDVIVYYARQYLSSLAMLTVTGLGLLVLLLVLPPVLLWLFSYVLDVKQRVVGRQPFPARYWGSALLITMVVAILTGVLTVITALPAFVLFFANLTSQIGTLQGDPSGMPDYMLWLNIVVFTLAGFIQAYVHLSSLFPLYYLHGSVEAQEQERKSLNTRQA